MQCVKCVFFTMPKRRCVFTQSLKNEFSFLRDAEEIGKVFCSVCKSVFSIENGGRADIKQHITTAKNIYVQYLLRQVMIKLQFFFKNKAQLNYLMKVSVSQQEKGYFHFIRTSIIILLDQWTAHQPF